MAGENQTRRILVKVDTSGSRDLQEIADKMGLLNKNTKSLASNFQGLTSVLKGWVAFLGVREITRMSDSVQNLSNRLKITAKAGEDTALTLQGIVDIANKTYQSIEGVGTVYNRMAIALQRAGGSSNEILALTKTLIDTFRVAGATTEETTSTIIQLSQAFTSGELRGQELRSVMEQNGVLAGLLAKKFGNNIYKIAEQGGIKLVDVLKLLAENQDKIGKQAEKLAPTFEQTLTKAANRLTLAIGKLNEEYQLSAKFAAIMEFASENLTTVLALLAGPAAALALSYIPALISALGALRVATLAFAAANPLLLAFTALVSIGAVLYANWDSLMKMLQRLKAVFLDFAADVFEFYQNFDEKLQKLVGLQNNAFSVNRNAKNRQDIADMRKQAEDIRAILTVQNIKAIPTDDTKSSLDSLIEKVGKLGSNEKAKKIKEILGDINDELLRGKITVAQYNEKLVNFELYKLNRQFKEGKFDVFEFNKRLAELRIDSLERQFNAGELSLKQFNEQVRNVKIEELNARFEAGKIGLAEYNSELSKISDKFLPGSALVAGTADYLKSIGTLSDGIAKAISQAFGHLEENITEFIKTGQFNFSKFAQAILDDLTKIIIRASIVKPLAEGILGGFLGGGDSYSAVQTSINPAVPFAKGGTFPGGIKKYASGGIVNSPTTFGYGSGKVGLMGEAGPEAILPLQRGPGGALGVSAAIMPVQVNIINQAGVDVTETQKTGPNGESVVEVMIVQKVQDGIAKGRFDKQFQQSYGLNRKGS